MCVRLSFLSGFVSTILLYSGCSQSEPKNETLFRLLPSNQTGITFANHIAESDSMNILTEEFIYNGAGVGVGDFDGDGLPDLFFAGNEVDNRLYLNRGNLTFDDVTGAAGVAASGTWNTAVTVVDINSDGLLDVYVCAAMHHEASKRKNLLFVNQGNNEQGVPQFMEMAEKYGIADTGYTMGAVFFDYNNDGLLDLYVVNNLLVTSLPGVYREKITDGSAGNTDQLYKNNGDGTFSNTGIDAGITIEGYGLGVAIVDVNQDGWPDIYVSNDYLSNDILYVNNRDGTFVNQIEKFIRHQAYYSMGVDAGDINNDGLPDFVALDMLAEPNFRKKTTINRTSYQTYVNNEVWGYQYQHIRNMLHLSNGTEFPFSEIGMLAGIYQTDWSWSPLLVDVDNDGHRDLLVTNGYPRDITDKDFTNYRSDVGATATVSRLLDSIPVVKIPNYAFANGGNLRFKDVSEQWGVAIPSFSNGAALADLDLDGDLDYIVSNINDEAFVFENTTAQKEENSNWLRIKLQGSMNNPQGIGAKIALVGGSGELFYHEQQIVRGYMSSVEDIVHIGLGDLSELQQVRIYWQEGRYQQVAITEANQVITLRFDDASTAKLADLDFPFVPAPANPVFRQVNDEVGLNVTHRERDYIDYNMQRTLPHKLSQYGPALAVGDVNGDGLEDLLVGGSAGYPTLLFRQEKLGKFTEIGQVFDADRVPEDMGILLFDMDNDGDLDLYITSGSIEYAVGNEIYQDRLYENDGAGNFTKTEGRMPLLANSSTCVRAADYDGDGFLDLFVGARSDQGQYPTPGINRLLRNLGGAFEDVTDQVAPGLSRIGMVTDALWTDFDGDGAVDLLVVGEFMQPAFFKNEDGTFVLQEGNVKDSSSGWWTGILAGDFDNDGDMDYVLGNWGLNNLYGVSSDRPLTLYAKDFDKNQSMDPVLFAYYKDLDGDYAQFPTHFWDELYGQSPLFRRRFANFKDYGRAGLHDVLSPDELEGAIMLRADRFESSLLENQGDGTFVVKPLPIEAQIAPAYGMVAEDVDGDGWLDILLVGNDYGNEVFSGRIDAHVGLVLYGKGDGTFQAATPRETGFFVPGDAKALVTLHHETLGVMHIASQNRGDLRVFAYKEGKPLRTFRSERGDLYGMLDLGGRGIRKVEFYYGSGFLSQGSRAVKLPAEAELQSVYTFDRRVRQVNP